MSIEDRKGWKVRPKCGGSWLFVNSLAELEGSLEHEGDDDSHGWELRRVTLTEDEAANMREFDGW